MNRPAPSATDDHGLALDALEREVDALREEVARLRAQLAEAERLADVDVLTPVLNRRAFVRELERAVARAERYGEPAWLLYFDLDGFKTVNDRFGHGGGDAALTETAARLAANVRRSDVVGRLGGDEFGVILVRTDGPAARAKAEALRVAIASEPVRFGAGQTRLAASCGVAEIRAAPAAEVLAEADAAMFASKPGAGVRAAGAPARRRPGAGAPRPRKG